MNRLMDSYWKRWLRKRGYKFSGGLGCMSKSAVMTLEEGAQLSHVQVYSRHVEVGAWTYIRRNTRLSAVSSIGRFSSIGLNVFVGQERGTHPLDWVSTHSFQYNDSPLHFNAEVGSTRIGHDVWVGHNATILDGVEIGTGAVVATHALVVKDVPPYAIVAGVPAKIIRYRHTPEIIEQLLQSRWWELSMETLRGCALNDPELALRQFEGKSKGQYGRIEVRRRGCRDLEPAD